MDKLIAELVLFIDKVKAVLVENESINADLKAKQQRFNSLNEQLSKELGAVVEREKRIANAEELLNLKDVIRNEKAQLDSLIEKQKQRIKEADEHYAKVVGEMNSLEARNLQKKRELEKKEAELESEKKTFRKALTEEFVRNQRK